MMNYTNRFLLIAFSLFFVTLLVGNCFAVKEGYYRSNEGKGYYSDGSSFYEYKASSGNWAKSNIPDAITTDGLTVMGISETNGLPVGIPEDKAFSKDLLDPSTNPTTPETPKVDAKSGTDTKKTEPSADKTEETSKAGETFMQQSSWKQAAVVAVGTGASSYLFNSLFAGAAGADSKTSQKAGLATSITGGVGAGIGSLFGGPMGTMIGGVAGSLVGSLISVGFQDKYAAKVDRKILINTVYVDINSTDELGNNVSPLALNKPNFKQRGTEETATLTSVGLDYNSENKYVKDVSGRKVAIYPIGFGKGTDMRELESGLLWVDYKLLDVNKLSREVSKSNKDISWESAKKQSEVEAVDDKVREEALILAKEPGFKNGETISFAMLFRNIAPGKNAFVLPNLSCFKWDGTVGATGPDAKPKVSFAWDYASTGQKKICSDGNVYCDATQFTLELVKRLTDTDGFNQVQGLHMGTFNKAIDLIPSAGAKSPLIGSNTSQFTKEKVTINLKKANATSADILIKSYKVVYQNTENLSLETVAKEGTNMTVSDSGLRVEADGISKLGLMESKYVVKFEYYVTESTGDVKYEIYSPQVDPTESVSLTNSEEVLKMMSNTALYNNLHFRASLMQDGYTNDFLADFKQYYLKNGFLLIQPNTKEYGLIDTMIPDKIRFLPKTNEVADPLGYKLRNAGRYNVSIVVYYKDAGKSKSIVDGTKGLAENVDHINVYLEPADITYNPLYYLPLNGTVGVVDGKIMRDGYGVDFKGNADIRFNNTKDTPLMVSPSLTSESNPIVHIEPTSTLDLQTFNGGTKRGDVLIVKSLGVTAGTAATGVEFYPSVPYRVAMKWTKSSEGDGYAFYTVASNQGPIQTGNRLIVWSQYCGGEGIKDFNNYDCQFFDGTEPIDNQARSDFPGSKARYAPTGQLAAYAYGLEVSKDSIIRDGAHNTAYLRGMFFLPKSYDNVAISFPISASDKAELSQNGTDWSNAITLGVASELNATNSNGIETVQDVYDLVETGWLCVSGQKNGSSVEFWWNPAKVYNPLYDISKSTLDQGNSQTNPQ